VGRVIQPSGALTGWPRDVALIDVCRSAQKSVDRSVADRLLILLLGLFGFPLLFEALAGLLAVASLW
jgi:hypothetical protein